MLTEGRAASGDPIEVLSRPRASVTVAEALRAYYGDAALMRRLLNCPDRDPKWDGEAERVLGVAAAGATEPDQGTS